MLRRPLVLALGLMLLLLLASCGGKKPKRAKVPPPPPPRPAAKATPTPVPPATAKKAPAVPKDAKAIYVEYGWASWYGPGFQNRHAANGEVYDMHGMTAAHRNFPLNSIVRVTNQKTGNSTVLRITDRGPFVEDRIIDLSLAAAKAIDVWRSGTAPVKIEVLSAPSSIEKGGRWCVQIGAFQKQKDAIRLKQKLLKDYETRQVIQFPSPSGGYWVRVKVPRDDKERAQEIARNTKVSEGAVFLVRLD